MGNFGYIFEQALKVDTLHENLVFIFLIKRITTLIIQEKRVTKTMRLIVLITDYRPTLNLWNKVRFMLVKLCYNNLFYKHFKSPNGSGENITNAQNSSYMMPLESLKKMIPKMFRLNIAE